MEGLRNSQDCRCIHVGLTRSVPRGVREESLCMKQKHFLNTLAVNVRHTGIFVVGIFDLSRP